MLGIWARNKQKHLCTFYWWVYFSQKVETSLLEWCWLPKFGHHSFISLTSPGQALWSKSFLSPSRLVSWSAGIADTQTTAPGCYEGSGKSTPGPCSYTSSACPLHLPLSSLANAFLFPPLSRSPLTYHDTNLYFVYSFYWCPPLPRCSLTL